MHLKIFRMASGVPLVSRGLFIFSCLHLELFQVFGSIAPVFELLLKGFSFKLLADPLGSASSHLNTVEGLPCHIDYYDT